MLTKKVKLVEEVVYFYGEKGPYKRPEKALEAAIMEHTCYKELFVREFLEDKKLLIALGDWAKEETKDD